MQKRLCVGSAPGAEQLSALPNPVQPIACIRIPSFRRNGGIAPMPEFRHRRREVKSVVSPMDDRAVPIREFASARGRGPIHDVVHQAGNSGLAAVFIPELTPNEADIPKLVLNP